MFDIGKTAELATLVAIPSAQRDDAWRERFFDAAWNASVVRHEPALFTGPDGLPYLRLDIPKPGPFDSNSLANFAEPCLQHATGVALFASPDAPPEAAAYVFSMGLIDSLVRHDSWIGDAIDRQEATETTDPAAYATDKVGERERLSVKTERQILTGTPSPELLPPHTARAMLNHIQSQWGISDPRIALLVDPALRPSRNLVIGVDRGSDPARLNGLLSRLPWFLPPRRMVMLAPADWDIASLTPLAELAERAPHGP